MNASLKPTPSRPNPTETMKEKSFAKNVSDTNQIGVELLITDAGMALTLLDMADTTKDQAAKSRRVREASDAYRSIRTFLARLNPTAEQMRILDDKLKILKTRLKAANIAVD